MDSSLSLQVSNRKATRAMPMTSAAIYIAAPAIHWCLWNRKRATTFMISCTTAGIRNTMRVG